jgi:hypothetical protein
MYASYAGTVNDARSICKMKINKIDSVGCIHWKEYNDDLGYMYEYCNKKKRECYCSGSEKQCSFTDGKTGLHVDTCA